MAFLSWKMEVNMWDLQMTTTEVKETPINTINFEGKIDELIRYTSLVYSFSYLFIQ